MGGDRCRAYPVVGRQGTTPAELWARPGASWPCPRRKKRLMMPQLLASAITNCMATACPSGDNLSEAENILKTKGRVRAFSKNEAENILKTSQFQ